MPTASPAVAAPQAGACPADLLSLRQAAKLIPGDCIDGHLDPKTLGKWALKGRVPYWRRKYDRRIFLSRQQVLDYLGAEQGEVPVQREAQERGQAEARSRETDRVLREVGLR